MPQDIKIWEIVEKDKLKEINGSRLDVEKRIEDWIEKDISIVSNDLLIIGRQVSTDFGGLIDILCLDQNGDVVIVELKRDKTPREITAQLLDYASWIKKLSHDRITDIANQYLRDNGPLEKAFREKFDEEIPDILNENHKMLIVASKTDDSSERIIEYLSDTYGVGINAATFQYFQDGKNEFLARVFLIEPDEAEYRIQTKSASKRNPALAYEELEEIADKNGVGSLHRKLAEQLEKYFNYRTTTRSSVAFIGLIGKEKVRKTIFSIIPEESNAKEGLRFKLIVDLFLDYFEITKEKFRTMFPAVETHLVEKKDGRKEKIEGYFKSEKEVDDFLAFLDKASNKHRG